MRIRWFKRLAVLAMASCHFCLLEVNGAVAKPARSPEKQTGGLEPREIFDVIKANVSQVQSCYDLVLKRDPKAQGKALATFVIRHEDGKVKSAVTKMKGELANADDVKVCITKAIRSWNFPKPRGDDDVTVNYPFVMNPL